MPEYNINDIGYVQTWTAYNKCLIAQVRQNSLGKWEYQVCRILQNNQIQEWGWVSERDVLTYQEFRKKYPRFGFDPNLIYEMSF